MAVPALYPVPLYLRRAFHRWMPQTGGRACVLIPALLPPLTACCRSPTRYQCLSETVWK